MKSKNSVQDEQVSREIHFRQVGKSSFSLECSSERARNRTWIFPTHTERPVDRELRRDPWQDTAEYQAQENCECDYEDADPIQNSGNRSRASLQGFDPDVSDDFDSHLTLMSYTATSALDCTYSTDISSPSCCFRHLTLAIRETTEHSSARAVGILTVSIEIRVWGRGEDLSQWEPFP